MSNASVSFRIINDQEQNITGLFKSISHTTSVEKDDELRLIIQTTDVNVVDRSDLQEGRELVFVYVYRVLNVGNKTSSRRRAVIQNIEPNFTETVINITLVCVDRGFNMKKQERLDVYQNLTAPEIVRQIARRNAMGVEVQDNGKLFNIPQAGKNDYDFLKELAKLMDGGKWHFFLRDNVIVFKERDLAQPSNRKYVYGSPNGQVKSFRPKSSQTSKSGASQDVLVAGNNPESGESTNALVNEGSEAALGKHTVQFDRAGAQVGETIITSPGADPTTGGKIITSLGDGTEAENVALNAKNQAALKDMTAELTIIADPTVQKDTIITISGVAVKFSGNWYVVGTRNDWSSSGAKTVLSLAKNASNLNSVSDDIEPDQNQSVGQNADEASQNGEVIYYERRG